MHLEWLFNHNNFFYSLLQNITTKAMLKSTIFFIFPFHDTIIICLILIEWNHFWNIIGHWGLIPSLSCVMKINSLLHMGGSDGKDSNSTITNEKKEKTTQCHRMLTKKWTIWPAPKKIMKLTRNIRRKIVICNHFLQLKIPFATEISCKWYFLIEKNDCKQQFFF